MNRLSKLREWINRNDGRLFRVDNSSLSVLEVIGYLVGIPGFLILSTAHNTIGWSSDWAICAGIVGFLLVFMGTYIKQNKTPK